ncbi:hypothetical protein [Niabella ginsengisoli]|uniref:TonB-dependent receptor n=1 Tax=Niabella ginsengisoli TaxID=522298 RepID=A0ABS9SHV3_9BACT|nr:hypothetical protein [Niabella ginsengisoli]MCH5597952.1 hypothetical protein [Niabella ginsengisoli]
MKNFQRTGLTQQYALNLRGGSNNISWLVAANHDRVTSVDYSKSNKTNFRFDNTLKLLKGLTTNMAVFYTNSESQSGAPAFNELTRINSRYIPYLNYQDETGQPIAIPRYRTDFTDTVGSGQLLDWRYYPLTDYLHDYVSANTQELIARLGLNYTIMKGLDASVDYQYQKQWVTLKDYSDMESFYTRDLINRFTELPQNTSMPVNRPIPLGDILTTSTSEIIAKNLRGKSAITISGANMLYRF